MTKNNKNILVISLFIVIAGIALGYATRPWFRTDNRPPLVVSNEPLPPAQPDETPKEKVFRYSDLGETITFDPIEPIEIKTLSLFKPPLPTEYFLGFQDEINYYKVGVVTNGSYKGGDLLLIEEPSEIGGGGPTHHLISKDGQITLIEKNSSFSKEYNFLDEGKIIIDGTSFLPQLIFPEKISYNGSTFSAQGSSLGTYAIEFFDDYRTMYPLQSIFKDAVLGDVFMDTPGATVEFPAQNGFYLKAPDGTIRKYALDIPFYDKNRNIPAIIWGDNSSNTADYASTDAGSCGRKNFTSVVTGVSLTDLVVAGKTSTNDPVYLLKDNDHLILKHIYDNEYNPYNETKKSYAEFIASRPAFFWFDPFDRLIKFQRMDFLPVAECGKPVIYLYPTEPTEVSVAFEQVPFFTKDIPTYSSGWNVLAYPNGELVDLQPEATNCSAIDASAFGSEYANDACRKGTYPYLYWSGKVNEIYPTASRGWIVTREELESFLTAKLQEIGLNKQERADMLSFWVPKLLEKNTPYYRLSLFTTAHMDQFIPMRIDPEPESRLRIFLDWSPLFALPEKMPAPQPISPFVRKGFTLVEWGGLEQ